MAFVVAEKSENVVREALRKAAEERLESWERPSEYRFIEELPRTTIGKVNYRQLEAMAQREGKIEK